MAFWNPNDLLDRTLKVQEFVTCLDLNVVLVNETHLRDGDTDKMTNYNVYRNDRADRRGGGTTIFARKIIVHYVVDIGELEKL